MQDGTASDPHTFLGWLALGNQHQYKIATHFELKGNMLIQRLHVNILTHHQLVVLLKQFVFHAEYNQWIYIEKTMSINKTRQIKKD